MRTLAAYVLPHGEGEEERYRVTLDCDGVVKVYDDLTEISFNGAHTDFRLIREHKDTQRAELYFIHDVDVVEFNDVDWSDDDDDEDENGADDGSGYRIVNDDFGEFISRLAEASRSRRQ